MGGRDRAKSGEKHAEGKTARGSTAVAIEAADAHEGPVAADTAAGSRPLSLPDVIEFDSLGSLLRHLRLTYFVRTDSGRSDGPDLELTQMDLIRCMKKHDYEITSGSFSLTEQGKTLPHDPPAFLDTICKCLAVEQPQFYWYLLRHQYAYDHLARTTNNDWAKQLIPTGRDLANHYIEARLPGLSLL